MVSARWMPVRWSQREFSTFYFSVAARRVCHDRQARQVCRLLATSCKSPAPVCGKLLLSGERNMASFIRFIQSFFGQFALQEI